MLYDRPKVFRDPIHGLISLDDSVIANLIDTPEFQRLRRIRQLGVSSFTYPGAEHTRFAHSIGVFHSAKRIIEILSRNYKRDTDVKHALTQRRLVEVAALLHDIGHGPFSHVSERAFESQKAHEERSARIIGDKDTSIHGVLEESFSDEDIRRIRGLLTVSEYPFLHDIVSSQLDADRMDYLLRDSHSAGVRYGHFDPEWVFNSFCLGLSPAPDAQPRLQNCRLCLDSHRGEHAAAQLIIARMHMSRQVYFHRATRNWEAHLICLIMEAAKLAECDELPRLTHPSLVEYFKQRGDVPHEVFVTLDDSIFLAHLAYWSTCDDPKHQELANWSSAILHRKKRFFCKDLSKIYNDPGSIEVLRSELSEACGPENEQWLLDDNFFRAYKTPNPDQLQNEPEAYWESVEKTAILMSNGDINSPSSPLQESSFLLGTMGSSTIPIHYLFYHPSIECKLEKLLPQMN